MKIGCQNKDYPDKYGHYREAKYCQTKNHWFWKVDRFSWLSFAFLDFRILCMDFRSLLPFYYLLFGPVIEELFINILSLNTSVLLVGRERVTFVNVCAKNYKNQTIRTRVIAKNVTDPILRCSVVVVQIATKVASCHVRRR